MSESYAPPPTDVLLGQMAWLRRLARDLTRDEAAADDVVQETMVAALAGSPRRPSALRAWLRAIARNVVRQRVRSDVARSRRERRSACPEGEDSDSAPDVLERAELHRRAMNAVLALEEPYRTTILLRYVDDWSPAEIAARRGLPAGTVRSRLKRGLDQVRDRLDREHGGDRRAWVLPLLALGTAERTPPAAASPSGATPWLKAAGVLVTGAVLTTALLLSGIGGSDEPPAAPPGEEPADSLAASTGAATGAEDAPETERIVGRTVDPSGKSVAARVALFPVETPYRHSHMWSYGRGLAARAPGPIAEASADGAFEIPRPPGGRVCLMAIADGFSVFPSDAHDLVPGDGAPLLVLGPAADVSGVVEDASGKPVSGAWVALLAGTWGSRPVANAWMRDRTGGDGLFRIRNAPAGPATLFVEHPDFAVALRPVQVPEANARVRLDPGRTVEGVVLDADDRPVPDTTLQVFAGALGPEVGASGTDGRFRIGHVPEGPDLTLVADGGRRGFTIRTKLGGGPAVVRLDPVVLRSVLVTEAVDGETVPVSGLDLALHGGGGSQFRALPRLKSDEQGRVEIVVREDVPWSLAPDARHPLYAVRLGFPVATAVEGEWELRLERKAVVTGRVLDAAGRAISGAEVGISYGGTSDPSLATGLTFTDADGRFSVRGVRPSEQEVAAFARHPDLGWAVSTPFPVRPGASIGGVTVEIGKGARIDGRVVDESGDPVLGARVRVSRHSAFPVGLIVPLDAYAGVSSGRDGRFRLAGLVERNYEMKIEREGYRSRLIRPVPASAAGHDAGDVVLARGHVLEGRVVDREGRPLFDAGVSAGAQKGGSWAQARSAVDGGFRLTGLAAVPHLLRSGKVGFKTAEPREVDVPSRSPVEIVLEAEGTGLAISGEVRDDRGKPVPWALVVATVPGEDAARSKSTAWADEKGRFRIKGLDTGEYRLTVLGGRMVFDPVAGIRAGTEGLVIRARRLAAIEGVVFLPDGSPAAGIRVQAVPESGKGRSGDVRTAGDGTFRIEGLSGEGFIVDAFGGGYASAPLRRVADGSVIEIRLAEELTIEGTATTADGHPVGGGVVVAVPESLPDLERRALTRQDGTFTLRGLFVGSWELAGSHHKLGRGTAGGVPAGRKGLRIEMKKGESR